MIHSSFFKPKITPVLGVGASANIDRAQAIDPAIALNRERVDEIGREDLVGYLNKTPNVTYRLTQLEYGNIEFWQKLINNESKGEVGQDAISQDDFKTSIFDISAYLTNDDGVFEGTYWYPNLRTNSWGLNIGAPETKAERTFDFIGEAGEIFRGTNQYIINNQEVVGSAVSDDSVDIDLSTYAPVVDPDNAGKYILRVVRVRAGVSTVLLDLKVAIDNGQVTYDDPTKTLTVAHCNTADVIKYWYSSATSPETFVLNDVDIAGILGDCVSIYLYIPATAHPSSQDYLYTLQSCKIDVKFTREDLKELGNKNVVQRGIRDKAVTITLGRILEEFTIEEVMRGAGNIAKIDIEQFTDNATLIIKIFSDNTKTHFKYGMKATKLAPKEVRGGITVKEYVKAENQLEGQEIEITADDSLLGI
jgi:hypothetical protein